MTDKQAEALKLALDALEEIGDQWGFTSKRTIPNRMAAITALREALAEQPVIECDCETATSPDGSRLTKCGSDQMRRAAQEGHAFFKQPAQQQEPDLSEQGRTRSAIFGNNVEAMMDAGLPFLTALETTLKVYDHKCYQFKAQPAPQPVQEQNRQIDQLIQERDHRDEIIDKLCDAVLGPGSYEWSSQYFFEDAVREVEERMAEQPASKPWVGLTDEDILRTKSQFKGTLDVQFDKFARAIEAKLREKNT